MKDLQYITHDMGARNDPKLLNVQMRMGGTGLAIFWCLVEMLWENEGYLPTDYEAIAFALRWAKPADVKRVVNEFELFVVEEDRFWSRSALERIGQKKEKIQATSEARRNAANIRWENARNASPMQMQSKSNAQAEQNDAYINKNINKDRKRDIDNEPLGAAGIYDIFLLDLNLKDPAWETERFLKHYTDTCWTYADGTRIKDPLEAARKWKPEKPGKAYDTEALNWYRAVWNAARERVPNAHAVFIEDFCRIRRTNQQISIVYNSKEAAMAAAAFIRDNDLSGDYTIDYRLNS